MQIDKLRDESIKHSEKVAAEIDKYLYGDDNELDESELVKEFEISKIDRKK
jgi:hypothetical protein